VVYTLIKTTDSLATIGERRTMFTTKKITVVSRNELRDNRAGDGYVHSIPNLVLVRWGQGGHEAYPAMLVETTKKVGVPVALAGLPWKMGWYDGTNLFVKGRDLAVYQVVVEPECGSWYVDSSCGDATVMLSA
jgi:hypothetical protein